jgi:hypothetical protein
MMAAGGMLLLLGACATYYNMTTTLGGSMPGQRSGINVMFINNTPYRAIFTFGTYDAQNIPSIDPDDNLAFTPQFDQFFASDDASERLEGNTSSAVFTFTCGRALSVGGHQIIQIIQIMEDEDLTGDLDESALTPGIGFSADPLDSDDADQPTAGTGDETVTLQGAEYQCDSLLVYTFSIDTANEECLGDTPIPDDCFITELDVLLP